MTVCWFPKCLWCKESILSGNVRPNYFWASPRRTWPSPPSKLVFPIFSLNCQSSFSSKLVLFLLVAAWFIGRNYDYIKPSSRPRVFFSRYFSPSFLYFPPYDRAYVPRYRSSSATAGVLWGENVHGNSVPTSVLSMLKFIVLSSADMSLIKRVVYYALFCIDQGSPVFCVQNIARFVYKLAVIYFSFLSPVREHYKRE